MADLVAGRRFRWRGASAALRLCFFRSQEFDVVSLLVVFFEQFVSVDQIS